MSEVGWTRDEILRSLKRLIAADNMTQKENAKVEAQIAIARHDGLGPTLTIARPAPDRQDESPRPCL